MSVASLAPWRPGRSRDLVCWSFALILLSAGGGLFAGGGACSAQAPSVTLTAGAASSHQPSFEYAPAGADVLLSARLSTPASAVAAPRATGTVEFYDNGTLLDRVALVRTHRTDYIAFGDSITQGVYLPDPDSRYPELLASALALDVVNEATIGHHVCDVLPYQVLPRGYGSDPGSTPLYSLLIGTNDLEEFDPASHEAIFNLCHQAILTWLAVPPAAKVLASEVSALQTTGTWITTSPSGRSAPGTASTSSPGSLTFTLPASAVAYLWYGIQTGEAGWFSVSIDGGPPSAPVSTQPASSLGLVSASYALLRLPLNPPVSAGVHTFTITALSGRVTLLGMGAPAAAGSRTVLAGDIPSQLANAALIARYTADVEANVSLLATDGLDLRLVPTQQFFHATPAELIDDRHPSSLGMTNLAQAFQQAITPFDPAPYTTTYDAAALTTASLTPGSHAIVMNYSGDGTFAPATAEAHMGIYDGSTGLTLTAPASAPPGTALSLVATVPLAANIPEPIVSGPVAFSETTPSGARPLGTVYLSSNTAVLTLPSLSPGTHTVTAQFLGGLRFFASARAEASVAVSPPNSTILALTTDATRAPYGEPVHGLATVVTDPSPAASSVVSPAASPVGVILLSDGGSPLATLPLDASGRASFTLPALAPGTHTLTADYAGDPQNDAASSPPLTLVITRASAAITLAASPASTAAGTQIAFSVAGLPAGATGVLTLSDGGTTIASTALPAVALPAAFNTTGAHTVRVLYSGDDDYAPGISAPVTVEILPIATSTALTLSAATSNFGAAIQVAVSVTPAAASGTVTLLDGTTVLASSVLTSGAAGYTLDALLPGAHTLTAIYSGDAIHSPSTSSPQSATINFLASTVRLGPIPVSVLAGDSLTLTATVVPSSASGDVLVRDARLGVLGQAPLAGGIATFSLEHLPAGSYSLTAVFPGDALHLPATSLPVVTQIVRRRPTLALAAPATAAYAAAVNLRATLAVPSGGAPPTGAITFFEGGQALGTGLLTGGSASLALPLLVPGTHILSASFAGDAENDPAVSNLLTLEITPDPSSTSLSVAQSAVPAGLPVTVNIEVSTPARNTPGGTVTLLSGSRPLASALLANGAPGIAYATITLPPDALGLGSYALAAAYAGDAETVASSSPAVAVTIIPTPTVERLDLSATQLTTQSTAVLTALVNVPNAALIPTGTITFFRNGVPLATQPVDASGQASITLTDLPIGTYLLTSAYAPSGLFAAASAAPAVLTITAPVALSLAPARITAGAGGTAAALLTLTPLSGFTGVVTIQCTPGAAFLTCSVDQPAATLAGGPVSTSLHLTVARTRAVAGSNRFVLLLLLLPLCRLRKTRRTRNLPALMVLSALVAASGCAASPDFNKVPTGDQLVTVSATARGTTVISTLAINITR